jgi:general secretion pathway protein D
MTPYYLFPRRGGATLALFVATTLGLCLPARAQQRPPVIRPLPGQVRPTTPPVRPATPAAAPAEAVGEPTLTVEEGDVPGEDNIILNMPNAPLESALDLYATLVDRVLLRPPQLAGGPINLKFDGLTREEAIEAMNAVFALNNISVIPVGEKFVKIVPSQQAVQEGAAISDLPAEAFSELGQFVTKLVKVDKIKPGDIAQAVQQFASGKVQNPVLVFDDQNFFILRDMAANVKRMAELIQELDVEPELDYELEVIPIRYGRVEEIYDTLNSVVTGQASNLGSASSRRTGGFRSGTTGTSTGSRFPTTPGSYTPQQAAASRITTPGAARTSFAQRLQQVTAAATGGGAQYNLLGDARIIPDIRSNSLIVYAGKEDFKMLTNIVAKIDTLLAQVLIESIILEVGLEKGQDFGVSMVQRPQQFGSWTTSGGSINNASIATNLLSAIFPSGFSYFGQYKDDFAFAITAMATDNNAKVLARPRIQTTHAQPAEFEIGDTVPYPRSSSPYYGGVGGALTPYTTYDEKKVTTRLEVTPYITPDGLVTLEVVQIIDQLGPTTRIGNDEIPTIRTRTASAVLSIRDREPVILGGFITDRRTESVGGVPWLKDIPLLGWAFRSKNDFKQRSELIVLIRPTILSTPQEASQIAELEQRSLPNAAATVRQFQKEEAEMAERLGVVPGLTNAPPEDANPRRNSRRNRRRSD